MEEVETRRISRQLSVLIRKKSNFVLLTQLNKLIAKKFPLHNNSSRFSFGKAKLFAEPCQEPFIIIEDEKEMERKTFNFPLK